MSQNTKLMLSQRLQNFERFNQWEVRHPLMASPQAALENIDFLYSLLPEKSRIRPIDPSGIRAMHRALLPLDGFFR